MQVTKRVPLSFGVALQHAAWTLGALLAGLVVVMVADDTSSRPAQPRAVTAPTATYHYASWIAYQLPLRAGAPVATSTYQYAGWIAYQLPVATADGARFMYQSGGWIESRLPAKEAQLHPIATRRR